MSQINEHDQSIVNTTICMFMRTAFSSWRTDETPASVDKLNIFQVF